MSWEKWNSSISSLVNQGLDEVKKMKDDVKKQLDDELENVMGKSSILPDGESTETIEDSDNPFLDDSLTSEIVDFPSNLVDVHETKDKTPSMDDIKDIKELNLEVKEIETMKEETKKEEIKKEENIKTINKELNLLSTKDLMIQQVKEKDHQLESALKSIAQLHEELQHTQQKLELSEQTISTFKSQYSNGLSISKSSENEEIQKLNEIIIEQKEKIKGLLEEGEILSKKQGTYEQRLRQLRKELNEESQKKEEIENSIQQSEFTIKSLQEQLEKIIQEKKITNKTMKSYKSSNELISKQLTKQTQDLEKIQQLNLEYLEALNESKEEIQRLKEQIDNWEKEFEHQGISSLAKAKEHWEQEQNMLESTIEQLRSNLQRHTRESEIRENSLRQDLFDMRKRWEDAVARIDEMGCGLSDATQPLLRQINALRQEQQTRQEIWRDTELSLIERCTNAETNLSIAESNKRTLEMEYNEFIAKKTLDETEMISLQGKLNRAEAQIKLLTGKIEQETRYEEELQKKLQETEITLNTLSLEKKNLEINSRRQLSTLEKNMESINNELELSKQREIGLKEKIKQLQGIVEENRRITRMPSSDSISSLRSDTTFQAGILQSTLAYGESSILEVQEMQQSLRQKGGETKALQMQLRALEEQNKLMGDEVVKYATENAVLIEKVKEFDLLKTQMTTMNQRHDVLLQMLGEYEEVKEAKNQLFLLQQKNEILLELLGEKEEQLEALSEELKKSIK